MKFKLTYILLTAFLLLSGCLGKVDAQVKLSASDRLTIERMMNRPKSGLTETFKAPANGKKVGVILRFDDENALDRALITDFDVAGIFGNRAVVYVDPEKVSSIVGKRGVRGAALVGRKYSLCSTARRSADVDRVQNGSKLISPYNGEGVIVALYDGGLDPNHINFMGNNGQSRVKRVWCYPLYDGWDSDVLPPEGYEMNEYVNPKEIISFTTDDSNQSHGTHVLGIAAGSYVNSQTKDYHGMAPAAELAIACGRFDDLSIMKGIREIADYAVETGKPCVINLSLGENSGPHDGTDEFTRFINDIAALPNITICVSAGNESDDDISLVKKFTETDTVLTSFVVGGSNQSATFKGEFEVWSEDETPFSVTLDVIDISKDTVNTLLSFPLNDSIPQYLYTGEHKEEVDSVTQSMIEKFSKYFVYSSIGGVRQLNEANNRYSAAVNLDLSRKYNYPNVYVAIRIEGSAGKRVFVYSPDSETRFTSKNLPGFDAPDGNGSINNIACGSNTIVVGAYSPALSVGSTYGTIAYFSSWSDMYDGTSLPHIVAPGVSIVSSYSRYYVESNNIPTYDNTVIDGVTYHWGAKSGTSMSCPVMSGIAALWLSANPDLSSSEIREIAMLTATTHGEDHIKWGAGRVNAFNGLKEVLTRASLSDVTAEANPILLHREGNVCSIFCNGAKNISTTVITLSGVVIARNESAGDSAELSLDSLSDGIYILHVITDRGSASFKIVK